MKNTSEGVCKKKIVFVTSCIQLRGVEKALLGMLNHIPKDAFDITLVLVETGSEYMDLVPDGVNIVRMSVPEQVRFDVNHGATARKNIYRAIKNGNLIEAGQIAFRKKILRDPLGQYTVPFDKLEHLDGKYDIAVCYHSHNPFLLRYVVQKISAEHKVAWLHNDFYASRFNPLPYREEFSNCDRIFGVSQQVVDEFKEIFPSLTKRVYLFNNIVPVEQVRMQAKEFYPEEYERSNQAGKHIILSIGGLDRQKGFDVAIESAGILKNRNIDFDWWILGEGFEESNLKNEIIEKGLVQYVHLIGTRKNPYPYIANAEIYVQPSRHEGYGIAVEEARILRRPVIATDFAGAREQIVHNESGLIVKFDKNEISKAIEELIGDKEKQRYFNERLAKDKFNLNLDEHLGLLLEW